MKILAIRGRNLASLEKEFEVDFTAEPLKSAGIFAITGSTGSGKSTLLDALCLALFNASPRTSLAAEDVLIRDIGDKTINHRDCRNILRRGAGEGYAEVDFVALNGDVYRSRWSARRARGKADGSMQSSELRLYNVSTAKEEQGLKTALLNKITQLAGLTFEQFTRSVLLAQGDFATFLKAKQSEKAELLEKLTGTDIYSRISIAIYERTKSTEAEWSIINERIKGIELLSDEQFVAIKEEESDTRQEVLGLRKNTEALNAQLTWLNDKERILIEVKQAEANLSAAQNSILNASKRYEYIEQIESVQDIRNVFGLLKNTEKQIAEDNKNLHQTAAQSSENSKLLLQAEGILRECEKEQELLSEKQKEIAPQIIRARELDVRIKAASVNTEDAHKELSATKVAFEKTEKEVKAIKQSLAAAEENLQSLNHWLAANRHYEAIAPRTELILNLATDAQTAHEQSEQNKKTLKSNNLLLEENIRQLNLLKQEADSLNNLLPAEIATLRTKLTDGEPCPVCGSTHHPAAKAQSDRQMKEQELNSAKEQNAGQTELLTSEIEKRKNEITRLSTLIENYTIQYDKAYRSLESNLTAIPEWKELFKQSNLNEYITASTSLWTANTEKLAGIKESIDKLRATLNGEENRLKDAAVNLKAKADKVSNFRQIDEHLSAERATVLRGKPADAAEQYFVNQQQAITNKLKQATDNRNTLAAKHESLKGIIGQIQKSINQSEEKYKALQHEFDAWINGKEGITSERLSELLGKDNAWIQAEKQALKTISEAETTAKATLAERAKNLEQHNLSPTKPENENETKAALTQKSEELNALTEKLSKRITEIEVALSSNEKALAQIKGLEKELKQKEELTGNWRKLNSLLGSSNGNKFKEKAQMYTLDILLTYANKHLQELSPRYSLQRIPETLALQIIDMDMLNEVRTIHSLSGGESFLVSLALALGLSSLSSNRMKVESLFIDEGFGSLDSDTLRTAIDALERLQTQGRKIGVISHVAEMTERIAVKIKVSKASNDKSEIEVRYSTPKSVDAEERIYGI